MEIIPVIDLKDGRAVRGRSGDRAAYRPVSSRLLGGEPEDLSDPVRLLVAYREALQVERVYVADLDRIGGVGDNHATIERLVAADPEVELLLDLGPPGDWPAWVVPGRIVPVVATETLPSLQDLAGSPARWAPGDALFGLDLGRDGVVARSPEVAAVDAVALLRLAARSGFRGAIVLLLHDVGTGAGLPRDRLRSLREAVPELDLYAAGGIASPDDLDFLRSAEFTGALLATALHEGWIHGGAEVVDRRGGRRRGAVRRGSQPA